MSARWNRVDRQALRAFALPGILAALCLVGLWQLYQVSASRALTPLENLLSQILILVAGSLASYLIGQHQGRGTSEAQARSALRRAVSLHGGLVLLAQAIEGRRSFLHSADTSDRSVVRLREVDAALDQLAGNTTLTILQARDVIADWGEIVPNDLSRLMPQASLSGVEETR